MDIAGRFFAHGSAFLAPVLYVQGLYTRAKIAKLPEAGGPREGTVAGDANLLRLLLMGESTAAGVGAADHNEGLAGQMARTVNAMTGATVNWQVHASNGLTAAGLRSSLGELATDTRPDLIVIVLGANDVFRLQGPMKWEKDLRALVDTIREQCGFAPVMLSAMPPIGEFPALPQPMRSVLSLRAQLLDDATDRLAGKMAGVHFVPLFVEEDPSGLFSEDGIHPSPTCYARWGRHIAEASVDHLPRRG
ncbi:MAG: SGNH/GDSL hydrolase family protein [Gammaproteobacteria bacterium]|nr:SGNH/GDSL hydrolase family protein [Gammaproteobacteria bacterium]